MYRFLERLPRYSHFHASVLEDDDSVEQLLARTRDGDESKSTFGMQGWTYERELLTTIVDALGQLHATLIQVNSENGRRPDIPMLGRPRTAIDRVEKRQAWREHKRRVSMLIPEIQVDL